MKNTNEKADNFLVVQMVFAATENQKEVSVIADYTDVLFCYMLHYLAQKLGQFAQYQQYLLCTDGSLNTSC